MFGDITITGILIIIGVLLVSMSVHEAMHAYTGLKLGDDTAAEEGRVSLNPLRHIDPFMTVLLPAITIILFQVPILAARPVPFNPDRVKWDEFGAALIAAAGPLSNMALAVIGALFVRLADPGGLLGSILEVFVYLNVALFVFNMLPIPPLDGSRVLYAFSPEPLQRFLAAIEPFGLFIVIGLIIFGGLGSIVTNLNTAVLQFLQ
ncbi:MAG TPA: site-2 protease family protein [Candidatus Saccharimonadales bacterium]|nr:site-2 protease family protein [Candidatus Saccharimonadales bacterium]